MATIYINRKISDDPHEMNIRTMINLPFMKPQPIVVAKTLFQIVNSSSNDRLKKKPASSLIVFVYLLKQASVFFFFSRCCVQNRDRLASTLRQNCSDEQKLMSILETNAIC